MYIKLKDYNGQTLEKGDSVLLSLEEFQTTKLKGVPLTVTPDGNEPVEHVEANLEG